MLRRQFIRHREDFKGANQGLRDRDSKPFNPQWLGYQSPEEFEARYEEEKLRRADGLYHFGHKRGRDKWGAVY